MSGSGLRGCQLVILGNCSTERGTTPLLPRTNTADCCMTAVHIIHVLKPLRYRTRELKVALIQVIDRVSRDCSSGANRTRPSRCPTTWILPASTHHPSVMCSEVGNRYTDASELRKIRVFMVQQAAVYHRTTASSTTMYQVGVRVLLLSRVYTRCKLQEDLKLGCCLKVHHDFRKAHTTAALLLKNQANYR